MTTTTLNPYSVDIAGRVQSYENLGDSWLVAVEKVATDLDLSIECIDYHYGAVLEFGQDMTDLDPYYSERGFVSVGTLVFLIAAALAVLYVLT